MIWVYLAGLATGPALFVLYVAGEMAMTRNLALECMRCERRFGVTPFIAEERGVKPTLNLFTRFKFKWHLWTGQCTKGQDDD